MPEMGKLAKKVAANGSVKSKKVKKSKVENGDAKKKTRQEDISNISLNDFMQKGFGSDDDSEDETLPPAKKAKTTQKVKPSEAVKEKKKKNKDKSTKKLKAEDTPQEDNEDYIDDIEDVESDDDDDVVAKPKQVDTEGESDDELNDVEVSDMSGDELPDVDLYILTDRKLQDIRHQLKSKPDVALIKKFINIFRAAVCEAAGEKSTSKFSVKGQTIFNGVILTCLGEFLPAVHKVLKLPAPSVPKDAAKIVDPTKGHQWSAIKSAMANYLVDMLKMVTNITQEKLVLSLLRHILLLIPYYKTKPLVEKKLLKTLSKMWSSGEESTRVVAFLCLIRIIRTGDEAMFQDVLKQMYVSYVANTRFTSPQTWGLISFMKRSMVEAYSLKPNVAYTHAFLYVRQLAITLRTAMTVKKKDSHKTVYNWQFVHSCLLWCHLLATVRTSAMEPLIYPVIQVIIGAINLLQTERFLPLRIHLIRGLIELTSETGVFVPIFPLLVSSIKLVNWDKKPKVVSLKPMNLTCALRVSERQSKETGFRDAVIESFQELSFGYLSSVSHLYAFPEMCTPSVVTLKKMRFKVVKYQTTVKQILEKISENSKFIEGKRNASGVALKEVEKVAAMELQLKGATPLFRYWEKLSKLREEKQRAANEDIIEDYDSEEEKEKNKPKKKKKKADDEEEMETEENGGDENGDDRGIGEMDADLDTDEEGDEEEGFEVVDDEDD